MAGKQRRPPYKEDETLAERKFRELIAKTIQEMDEIKDVLLPGVPTGEDLGDQMNNLMIVYAIALGGC